MQKKPIIHQLLLGLLLLLISPFNAVAQVVDTTFKVGAGANNEIRDMLLQSDGKILIAGLFTTYNGKVANRIARVNPDGSLDTTFHMGTGANFNVYTLALQQDEKILVGGDFTSFNQKAVNRIIRLNSNGSIDTSFSVTRNPNAIPTYAGANSKVFRLRLLENGKIMVAGCFNNFDGSSTNRFARLNANGSVDATFTTSFSPFAFDLAVQTDGKLFVSFQSPGKPLRLNTDGSIDNSFNSGTGPDGVIENVGVLSDQSLWASGLFLKYNSQNVGSFVDFNPTGSLNPSFKGYFNGQVKSLIELPSQQWLAAGYFKYKDGEILNIIRLSPTGLLDSTFNVGSGTNDIIKSMAVQPDQKIIIAGNFTTVDGKPFNRIARLIGKFPAPANPTISTSGLLSFCQGDSVTLTSPAGFAAYQWSNGATTKSLKVKEAGSFTLRVKQANTDWSEASAPIKVTVFPLSVTPTITASRPLIFCQGDSVVLTALAGMSGYRWSTGATSASILVKQSGVYSVRVKNATGCESLASPVVKVQVDPLPNRPTIVPPSSLSFCQGDSILLSGPTGFSTYQWSDGATTASIWAKKAGSYSLQVFSASGCASPASLPVSAQIISLPTQPTITTSGPLVFCQGDSVVLSAPEGMSSYLWSTGATSSTIPVKQSGSYWVKVKTNTVCESLASPLVSVTVNALPTLPIITLQEMDTLMVSTSAKHFHWEKDGQPLTEDTQKIKVTQTGSYRVSLENEAGCHSAYSSAFSFVVTGLELMADMDVVVYPNPAQKQLFIKMPSPYSASVVSLYNPLGQVCRHFNTSTPSTPLSLEGLAAGVYVVQIRIGAYLIRKKVAIQ